MQFLTLIRSVTKKDDLVDILFDRGKSLGFEAFAYILPKAHDPNSVLFLERGFPGDWAARYQSRQYNLCDPTLHLASRAARSFQYSDVARRRDLKPDEYNLLDEEKEAGLGDGYLVPVFGRFLKNGWIIFRQMGDKPVPEDADLAYLEALAFATHNRCDQIVIEEKEVQPNLAPREQAILQWMAAGKTNAEIAIILSIGLPTVSTYVRRLFQKLDVTDRTSAVTKGIRYGLIFP